MINDSSQIKRKRPGNSGGDSEGETDQVEIEIPEVDDLIHKIDNLQQPKRRSVEQILLEIATRNRGCGCGSH